MKKKKYLPLYYKWMEAGRMLAGHNRETSGLCDYFKDLHNGNECDELFELMKPTEEDFEELKREGKSCYTWASELPFGIKGEFYTFTPLRQNIVLLMAAMNGEL